MIFYSSFYRGIIVISTFGRIEAIDGQTCNPTCVKGGDVCMRYSYFDRDGDQTMSKYVNFCGKGVQG